MEADFFGSPGGYRDYGGGYKIDCYSALGLLGLLGLLEILRDLVEDVTEMRRRRSVPSLSSFGAPEGIRSSLKSQIPEDVLEAFPGVVMPLLHVVADVNDRLLPPECLELAVCKSNQALTHPQGSSLNVSYSNNTRDIEDIFGLKNKTRSKIAQLITEVLSKAFFSHSSDNDNLDKDKSLYVKALVAGENGRNNINCEEKFKNCSMEPQYHPQPNFLRDYFLK